jgi:hypothetical protein
MCCLSAGIRPVMYHVNDLQSQFNHLSASILLYIC